MKSTIRDVAKLASVSVGSVSNVFNGKNVGENIYLRVMEAASLLDYTPDAIAKKLASRKTQFVGLFVANDEKEMFFSSLWGFLIPIIHGIFKVAETQDYSLHLDFSTLQKVKRKNLFNQIVKEKSLDGIFIFLRWPIDYELLSELERESFPAILINGSLPGVNIPSIKVNNFKGAKAAIDYLVKLGHSKIAMITGPPEFLDVKERIEGYKESLARHGIPYNPTIVRKGDFFFKSGYAHAKELIKLKKRPTAIFCANDHMAAGAIKAAKEENLSVPTDISILGFDDQIIAEMLDPPLTTVRQPLYQAGILSARRLFNIIEGKIHTSFQEVLDTKLIVRNSCASQKELSFKK